MIRVCISGWTFEPWRGLFYPEGLPHKRELADVCGDVVYARLMRSTSVEVTRYSTSALNAWAERALAWEKGAEPDGMTRLGQPSEPRQRNVFGYFISGAKERTSTAALALLERLRVRSTSKGGIAGR